MYKKFNRNERGSANFFYVPLAACTGVLFASVVNLSAELDDSKQFSQDVQGYNSAISSQLNAEYSGLDDLVLSNSDGQKFTFHMTDAQGRVETCHGAYEVKNKVAQAVGQISCSYSENLA